MSGAPSLAGPTPFQIASFVKAVEPPERMPRPF
jgi:hypothetical protein